MERENEPDNLDINDYHRLRYLGDNVNEILQSVLENIRAGIGLFEVGESIRALYLNDAYFQCIGYSKEDYDKEIYLLFYLRMQQAFLPVSLRMHRRAGRFIIS